MENYKQSNINGLYIAIKTKRESMNVSLTSMANKLAISKQSYTKIENGLYTMSVDRLIHIAEILNIKPADLLSGI